MGKCSYRTILNYQIFKGFNELLFCNTTHIVATCLTVEVAHKPNIEIDDPRSVSTKYVRTRTPIGLPPKKWTVN